MEEAADHLLAPTARDAPRLAILPSPPASETPQKSWLALVPAWSIDILRLSKMNWNTFDLYTKLPATVQSANEIARIGSLLGRFEPRTYDFRLFI